MNQIIQSIILSGTISICIVFALHRASCVFTVSTTITFMYCLHFQLTIDVLLFMFADSEIKQNVLPAF